MATPSSLVSQIQKELLFEEAAKEGLTSSNVLSLGSILENLIGITDIGTSTYGAPLTPIYNAVTGNNIDISRFSNYFVGLGRDVNTVNLGVSKLNLLLDAMKNEIWVRASMATNRANNLTKLAANFPNVSDTSTWQYTETFHSTANIDMQFSTASIDTSAGQVSIPTLTNEIVKPSSITYGGTVLPTGGDFLGTTPDQAFDGLTNTSWVCSFSSPNGQYASSVFTFDALHSVSSISITPVGVIDLLIYVDSGQGLTQVTQDVIAKKSTYTFNIQNVSRIQLLFYPANKSLPQAVGLSHVYIGTSETQPFTVLYSTALSPTNGYSELFLNLDSVIPNNTNIQTFYSLGVSGNWSTILPSTWTPITNVYDTVVSFSINAATKSTANTSYGGLYGFPLNNGFPTPLTLKEGILSVGVDSTTEVSAFFHDWSQEGDAHHVLSPNDFVTNVSSTSTTWSNVPTKLFPAQQSTIIAQPYGSSNVNGDGDLQRGGNSLIFQRTLTFTDDNITPSDTTYKHLTIVPLQGLLGVGITGTNLAPFANNAMQYGFNYKFKFIVNAQQAFSYPTAKFWFLQGYRNPGAQTYASLNKSYATVSIYINGQLVGSSYSPDTIYTDGTFNLTTQTSVPGTPLQMSFNPGQNTVEICMFLVNASLLMSDTYDTGAPYVQFSMTPSIFDPLFYNDPQYPISEITASGDFAPSTEFDLLWNLPSSPGNWAWSLDGTSILFNSPVGVVPGAASGQNSVWTLPKIDYYFQGVAPMCTLQYTGSTQTPPQDVYLKMTMTNSNPLASSPLINDYTLKCR